MIHSNISSLFTQINSLNRMGFLMSLEKPKHKLFHAAFCWVKLQTHMTPKRSLNMIWFLKVLLMSKSICLISVEKLRACCFILWRTKKWDKMSLKFGDFQNLSFHSIYILEELSSLLRFRPRIFRRSPFWLSLCPEARPRPGLSAAEGCLYTHASPTETHMSRCEWGLSRQKETLFTATTRKERQQVKYTRCVMVCSLFSSLEWQGPIIGTYVLALTV